MPRLGKSASETLYTNIISNIRFYQTFYKYNDKKIQSILGISKSTLENRKKNPGSFRIDELHKLSASFKCSLSDLVSIRRE